jgi:hypothetical protein
MSWLSEQADVNSSTVQSADPNTFSPAYFATVKANNPGYYEANLKQYDPAYKAEQQAAADAALSTGTAVATQQAAAVNPVTQAQSATEALNKLLAGFGGVAGGASFVPGTLDDPAISNIFGAQKTKAQDYIGNLLKRGVVTQSGKDAGISALSTQEPGVRTKLNDIGNLLLEQERGKVRGIYNEGAQAAGGVAAGASFDPTPYVSRAQNDVSTFSSHLPDAIAAQVTGDLFDTSGLSGASGAPASGQTSLDLDPYAGAGGKLNTGLETSGGAAPPKRRSTAVF